MESILSILNDNCFLAIFKYLNINDSINFGDTCTYLQALFNANSEEKFSELTVTEDVIWKGIDDRVWYYYGQHLTSIQFIYITNKIAYRVRLQGFLSQLKQHAVRLQEIKLFYCQMDVFDQLSFFQNVVEKLTIYRCTTNAYKAFINSYSKLKLLCVETSDCYIESLVKRFWIPQNITIGSLVLIGNLSLKREDDTFLSLPNLTKLKLSFGGLNGHELLKLICEKGIKELQLDDILVDESTFDIIKSYDLQLLSVSGYPWNYQIFSEGFVSLLPSSLKHLQLCGFRVSMTILISIVERLKFLEDIDVYECKSPESESSIFEDSKTVSQMLQKALNVRENEGVLTVTLPRDYGRVYTSTKKKFVYVDGIQLVNNSFYFKTSSPFFDCLPNLR